MESMLVVQSTEEPVVMFKDGLYSSGLMNIIMTYFTVR